MVKGIVSTVRPKASDTPTRPMPRLMEVAPGTLRLLPGPASGAKNKRFFSSRTPSKNATRPGPRQREPPILESVRVRLDPHDGAWLQLNPPHRDALRWPIPRPVSPTHEPPPVAAGGDRGGTRKPQRLGRASKRPAGAGHLTRFMGPKHSVSTERRLSMNRTVIGPRSQRPRRPQGTGTSPSPVVGAHPLPTGTSGGPCAPGSGSQMLAQPGLGASREPVLTEI